MTEPDVFVLADEALVDVVKRIRDDQWPQQLPDGFLTSRTEPRPTLREVVNYHAYDDAWVPDMLAGRTMDEAGRDKFDGDLLGADPKASFAAIAKDAWAAARNLDDLDRVVRCSFGDFPMVQGVWDEIVPHVEEWRALGVFPAAVPVPDDAPLLHRLLGLTGRDPAWRP